MPSFPWKKLNQIWFTFKEFLIQTWGLTNFNFSSPFLIGSQIFWSKDLFILLKSIKVPQSFSLYGLNLCTFAILEI